MTRRNFIDVVWVAVLMGYLLIGINIAPLHGDESTLIYTTRDYADQFINRDLSQITYNPIPADAMVQSLRLIDGRVHKYLAGFFWHVRGYTLDDINQNPWQWGADWAYNQSNDAIPSPEILVTTRWASALLAALGVAVMFGIGLRLDGRVTAYAASLFYALHPALLLNGRRSMMEGSLLLFTLLTVLAGLLFLRKRTWWSAALLGLAAGMSLASKHTSVFTLVAVFGALGVYLLFTERARAWRGIASLLAATVLALGIFYLFNPVWWGQEPLTIAQVLLDERERVLNDQLNAFATYPTLGDAVTGFGRQVFVGLPQYYEVDLWAGFIGGEIAAYEASPWRGVSLGASVIGLFVLIGLCLLGIYRLLRPDREKLPERWLIGAWVGVVVTTVVIVTPFEWQRYYLPTVPPVLMLAALGVGQVGGWVARPLRQRSTSSAFASLV